MMMSYLLGSIPTAYLIGKSRGVDVFDIGSGNMGATNISRAIGLRWGVLVMLLDIFKGVVAITLSRVIMSHNPAAATVLSALAVILGHNWSLFATILTGTLRGGKGAATAFGTLMMIAPFQVIVAMAMLGGVIVARTRYVSLAVLAAFTLGLAWLVVLALQEMIYMEVIYYSVILAALLAIRFKGNIQRLLAGTERRLGERA